MGILATGMQSSRRRLRRLAGSGRADGTGNCPACGRSIPQADHAVVVHGERYHVGCALYSRPG